MIKFSSSFKLNEIHRIDSPFNEDPQNIFFREALISGEGRPENLGKTVNNRDIYCYANGVANFERAYQPLPPGTKILFMDMSFKKIQCLRYRVGLEFSTHYTSSCIRFLSYIREVWSSKMKLSGFSYLLMGHLNKKL